MGILAGIGLSADKAAEAAEKVQVPFSAWSGFSALIYTESCMRIRVPRLRAGITFLPRAQAIQRGKMERRKIKEDQVCSPAHCTNTPHSTPY